MGVRTMIVLAALGAVLAFEPVLAGEADDSCSGLSGSSVASRIQACTAVIASGSADAVETAYGNRAHLYDRSGNTKMAIADISEAIKRDPNDAQNFIARSGYRIEEKTYKAAIEDSDSAIAAVESGKNDFDPDDENNNLLAGAYADRALARLRLKQRVAAIADFQKALSFPADADTLAEVRTLMAENHIGS